MTSTQEGLRIGHCIQQYKISDDGNGRGFCVVVEQRPSWNRLTKKAQKATGDSEQMTLSKSFAAQGSGKQSNSSKQELSRTKREFLLSWKSFVCYRNGMDEEKN